MDIISSLPLEISLEIFKCMDVRDLFNCMSVCKSWRNLINSDYVWRRFYSIYDIEELSSSEEIVGNNAKESLSCLCSRANEVKKFRMSPAFNWMSGRFKDFYITLKYREWKAICHESYIAVHYILSNELHVFHCFGYKLSCITVITVPVLGNYDPPILLSSKYIVIGACNITLVYKLIEGKFVPYRIFALESRKILSDSTSDFLLFVVKYVSSCESVFERVLIGDFLWITEISGLKHIINLDTDQKEIMRTPLLQTKIPLHYQYVLNFAGFEYIDEEVAAIANNGVAIANRNGEIISSFTELHSDKIFFMNREILVIYYPRLIENGLARIECREILSGKLIRKILVHEKTRTTLHPMKNILYLMSSCESVYKITSLNIETGNSIWTYKISSKCVLNFGSFLTIIHERFLVAYPAPANNDCYAVFNLKGKLLYESPYILGTLLYLSGSMILANEAGRLHLISFLHH